MFHRPRNCDEGPAKNRAELLAELADCCSRPRYAYMLLSLLADIARPDGSAGPMVARERGVIPLRDWLCEALGPLADRDGRRKGVTTRVMHDLAIAGDMPDNAALAVARLDEAVRARVLASGKTNVSRTVSELVRAGLLTRHYQGYRIDHAHRGAQRQCVYTLAGTARKLLQNSPDPPRERAVQLSLL